MLDSINNKSIKNLMIFDSLFIELPDKNLYKEFDELLKLKSIEKLYSFCSQYF